jgi:glycosyltransferase involved in cell wall biosynthesis
VTYDTIPTSKKLLIVAEFDSLNGGEQSMLAVLPLLIESGWRIKIAFPNLPSVEDHQTLADRIRSMDVRGITLTTHHADGVRKSQSEYRSDFAKVLKSHQPDLVLCNSLSTGRLCGPVTAELGIAAVGYLRDIINLSNKAVQDVNQLDQIVAVSQATKDHHAGQGMTASKITVIHNGVDLELFRPDASRLGVSSGSASQATATDAPATDAHARASKIKSELGIPASSPALLFVGQIGMRKGVDVLLDVFEKVVAPISDCHLLIVGRRHSTKQEAIQYESDLIQRSQSDACAGQVHWLHRRDDMPDIYAGVDLLLHPARQEPLGRVILEAVSSGLPVLTTFVGGSPEILGCHDSFDLLCPVDDAQTMADRAIAILQDDDLRRSIAQELRTMAQQRFDRRRCHAELEVLLEKMLAQV